MRRTILLFCSDYKPNLGGVGEMAYNIALGLHRAGWRVVVLAPEGDASEFDCLQPFETIRAIPICWEGLLGKTQLAMKLWVFRRHLRHIVEAHRICYILSTDSFGYMRYLGYLRGVALNGLSVPKGVVFHGKDVVTVPRMPWIKRRLFRNIIAKMDDVFCNSHFTADNAIFAFGRSLDPVVVGCGVCPDTLPPPIEQEAAHAQLNINARHVILTVARFVPRKGMDMVIRSLPEVLSRVPDLLYVVAGAGLDLDRLRQLAEQNGCGEHVRFDEPFDNRVAAHYYYCAADIFVMPARHIPFEDVEGFGIVYAEAGHYGLPVIGGRAGGVPDAIVDGHTGFLVNPEDPHEIAEAIVTLLEDPALSRQLGTAGQKRVHNELTWDAVTERIINKVRSTLNQGS